MVHLKDTLQKSDGEAPAVISLRPMGFADILDTTFSLYRNRFRLFLCISAVYFFSHIVFSNFTHWIISFCELVLPFLCYAALTFASAQAYLGKHITVRVAFKQVKYRFWTFFGSSLLYWIVVVLLSVSIIGIPFAIYFLTRWSFYVQTAMVEKPSAANALKRSSELVKGAWWRVFGIIIAIWLIYFMIDVILITSATLIFASSGIASEVDLWEIIRRTLWEPHGELEGILHLLHAIQTAISALTMPITAIGFTLLYFDLRIRKEGFDIEMMLARDEL